MKCSTCKETKIPAFMIVGDKMVCLACAIKTKKSRNTVKVENIIPTQFFTQWICKTHNCGTPNVNIMNRHGMDDCEIVTRQLPQWHRPKTFGGYNGDISRKWWPRKNRISRKEVKIRLMRNWEKMIVKIRAKYGLDKPGGGNYAVANRRRKASRNRS